MQQAIGRLLGFGSMTVPSRALGDHLAENICVLGLLAATCGRIGREIYTLMETEFGEVEEPVPPGTVGKLDHAAETQPEAFARDIIAAAAGAHQVPWPRSDDHRARGRPHDQPDDDSAEQRACVATGDMLGRLAEVMRGLRVDPARMRANPSTSAAG